MSGTRRVYRAIERSLHQEIALRLKLLKPRCVYFPVPNGLWLPARTEEEKLLVRRLISQMKKEGMLQPGVADWVFLWPAGNLCLEEKRPATTTLFEKLPRGQLSPAQKVFRDWCVEIGVDYRVIDSWDQVLAALKEHGLIGA